MNFLSRASSSAPLSKHHRLKLTLQVQRRVPKHHLSQLLGPHLCYLLPVTPHLSGDQHYPNQNKLHLILVVIIALLMLFSLILWRRQNFMGLMLKRRPFFFFSPFLGIFFLALFRNFFSLADDWPCRLLRVKHVTKMKKRFSLSAHTILI